MKITVRGTANECIGSSSVAIRYHHLAGHPIVLLDEPTEHLDEINADEVARQLLRALDGRTVVWVAHRPHGLVELDHIVPISRD